MFKKILKCICRVDEEGDNDGISKPVSEITDQNEQNEQNTSQTKQQPRKPSLLTPPKSTKQNKSNSEDKHTLPSTQDLEMDQNGRKSLSPIGSLQDLEPKIEKKEDFVIFEAKEEEELDIIYGTKLLNKRKISKRDVVEIFS